MSKKRSRDKINFSEKSKKTAVAAPRSILNPIVPKTAGQEKLLDTIESHEVVICDGPAGTGKTICSFGLALKYYLEYKSVQRIIIIRPTIPAGDDNDLGFLPGGLHEKMLPFLAPIVKDSASLLLKPESFRNNFNSRDRGSPDPLASLLTTIEIEVVPIAFARGRTFNHAFIILDEAQNCTLNDFKLILTRIGKGSKIVIEGDSTQADIDNSGFIELQERMSDLEEVGLVRLTRLDIIRNPLISKLLERL